MESWYRIFYAQNKEVARLIETHETQESSSEEKETQEPIVPQSRFKEINQEYVSLKSQLEEMKEAQKQNEKENVAKEQEDAEKRGEYEGLYKRSQVELESVKNERKAVKERISVLEGVINQLLDSKLETIDKEYHDLIPAMPPEQKLTWVTQAEKKGLFGNLPSKQTLGEQTNPAVQQDVSMNKMNPLQKILAGYSRK